MFPLRPSMNVSAKQNGGEICAQLHWHKLGYVKKKPKKTKSTADLNRSLNYCYHFGLHSAFSGNSLCCQAANSSGTVRRMLLLEFSSCH